MILTFVNDGTSNSASAINYLFSEKDGEGNIRNPPAELFEGDVFLTKYLIDTCPRDKKYSSYALAFRDSEKPTDLQLKEIVKSLRETFCTGLGPDRVNLLVVKHLDKNSIELHIIIPDTEMTTGKQFNPFPGGERSQQLQKDFCAFWNHKLGYEQVIGNPFKAAFSRFDAKVPSKRKKEYLEKQSSKEGITDKESAETVDSIKDNGRKQRLSSYAADEIMSGRVNNRDELIAFLETKGCKITRQAEDSLSIKLPGKEKAIRFKGGAFVKDVDYRTLIAEHKNASKHLTTYQFKQVVKRIESQTDYKRDLFQRMYSPKKRVPKAFKQSPKFVKSQCSSVSKAAISSEPKQLKNASQPAGSMQKPQLKDFKSLGSSSVSSNANSGGGSLESLQLSIGNLESKITALGMKLSQVPASQHAAIKAQIAQMRIQLMRLQQQLEDAKKASLNRMKI